MTRRPRPARPSRRPSIADLGARQRASIERRLPQLRGRRFSFWRGSAIALHLLLQPGAARLDASKNLDARRHANVSSLVACRGGREENCHERAGSIMRASATHARKSNSTRASCRGEVATLGFRHLRPGNRVCKTVKCHCEASYWLCKTTSRRAARRRCVAFTGNAQLTGPEICQSAWLRVTVLRRRSHRASNEALTWPLRADDDSLRISLRRSLQAPRLVRSVNATLMVSNELAAVPDDGLPRSPGTGECPSACHRSRELHDR